MKSEVFTWDIEQFCNSLVQPLQESDGISDAEIDAQLNGQVIPKSMRAYYRVAGNHWLNTNHNQLMRLDSLETVDGYTIFMDENQVVVQWAIRESEMKDDDPIVYLGQSNGQGYEWFAEKFVFSQFMIATWKWTLTGEES